MKNLKQRVTNQSLVFKRWNGKSYSAFNTVGKVVAIAMLNIAYFGSLGTLSAQENQEGQTTISKNVDLEEVEVVAASSPQLASEAARVVEVISQKEIQAASAQSVNELLEFALGVDIRQRGTHGIQADLSIRGGSFDQVMVLLNGVNITDPQTGHYNLNLPVDILSIERIEILEGPGARYWGPNAFSGAVNFVTKDAVKNEVNIMVSGGEYGYGNVSADATYVKGKLKQYLFLGGKRSDGYIPNADYKMYTGYYNLSHESDFGKTFVQLGYSDKGFGANTFYTPKYPFQFDKNRTGFASIKYETKGDKFRFSPQAYYRRNHDRFELYREQGYFEKQSDGSRVKGTDTVPSWYKGHNYHMTTILGGELNGKYYSSFGITSFGITMRNEQIYSNVLGLAMNETMSVPGEADGVFTKSSDRLNTSFFMEHFYSRGIFSGSIGVMGNHNSSFSGGLLYYPGIDLAVTLSKNVNWYGSASTSFRLPTFTDLYYNGPTNVGNPDLKVETARTYETGFKYKRAGVRAHASVYYREGKDLIDWVRLNTADLKFSTVNHNEANTFGLELQSQWSPRVQLGDRFPITNITLSYSYLNTKVDLKGMESGYVGDYLKHKFTAQLSHPIVGSLSAHWGVNFQDREGQYEKFEGLLTQGFVNYDPFMLVDVKVKWDKPKYQLYVQASNLLNTDYVDFGNIAQPGRWVIAGAKFNIGY